MIASYGEILFDVYPDKEYLGGAPFNFIYHIYKLTGDGTIVSRIGNDERGKKIQTFLTENNIDQRYLQIDDKRATGTATVHLDNNGIPTFTIDEEVAYDFIEMPEMDDDIDMLYFGTLAQRSITSRQTLHRVSHKTRSCFLDVNLRQQYYSKEILQQSFNIADIVKLNMEELHVVHQLFFPEPFELHNSVKLLMKKFSLSHLAVTLGEKGSWMFSENETHYHCTTIKHVVDTVGAGDGFSAMMCLGILRGWPLKEIHQSASEFSALLCGFKGALPHDDVYL